MQIKTQHEDSEMICEDTKLSFPQTDKLVFIQIFQQGRTAELKQAVYKGLQERLEKECGVPGTALTVCWPRNETEDGSFEVRARFLTGEI